MRAWLAEDHGADELDRIGRAVAAPPSLSGASCRLNRLRRWPTTVRGREIVRNLVRP